MGSKQGQIWQNSKNSAQERALISQLPHVLNKMNTGVVAHANALQLSVLDLPKLYQLASHPDFEFLFDMNSRKTAPHKNPHRAIVELPCSNHANACQESAKHSSVKTVAQIWAKAVELNFHEKSEFEVRYITTESQQNINSEIWVYYENIGPRYLRDVE